MTLRQNVWTPKIAASDLPYFVAFDKTGMFLMGKCWWVSAGKHRVFPMLAAS